MALGGLGTLAYLWPRCSGDGCPSVTALRSYVPPQASRVYDRSGGLVGHLAPERRIVVPLGRIPNHVAGAFLAVEDRRFYRHGGVDWRRAVGALVRDIQARRFAEGFSTITMQLARNLFPEHLTRAKTVRRKLWEIVLARRIEQTFPKDQILELYLNQIYLGDGLYGVEAAAQGYFGKSVGELDAAEAATLAALPKAPSYYNPRRNPEAARKRRNVVLGLMSAGGVITPEGAEQARSAPLRLAAPREARTVAPYFVAAVRQELHRLFGSRSDTEGLRVYTSLDTRLQRAAESALRAQIRAVEAGELGRFPGGACEAGERDCLQGLFVALDAASGEIRALVGGRDFGRSQFDRVTRARRQSGSAFKPIVYAAALARGITIPTRLTGIGSADAEVGGVGYRPADAAGADTLAFDLRSSIRVSSNRAAVALGTQVGLGPVITTARMLGISTPIPEFPSTFLGAAEVSPLELVAAYAPFANGGWAVTPRLIERVEDPSGRTLWRAAPDRQQVLQPGVAFLLTTLLQDVVDRGTGFPARSAGLPPQLPAAGKTGTTNQAQDVWFVGYTPELVAGVWLGFDRPRPIAPWASGGRLAAPVWGRALGEFYAGGAPPLPWQAPADVASVGLDTETGAVATPNCPAAQTAREWFLVGTEPKEQCPLHPESSIGAWMDRTLDRFGDWLRGDEPPSAPTPPAPAAPAVPGAPAPAPRMPPRPMPN